MLRSERVRALGVAPPVRQPRLPAPALLRHGGGVRRLRQGGARLRLPGLGGGRLPVASVQGVSQKLKIMT